MRYKGRKLDVYKSAWFRKHRPVLMSVAGVSDLLVQIFINAVFGKILVPYLRTRRFSHGCWPVNSSWVLRKMNFYYLVVHNNLRNWNGLNLWNWVTQLNSCWSQKTWLKLQRVLNSLAIYEIFMSIILHCVLKSLHWLCKSYWTKTNSGEKKLGAK